MTSLMFVTDYMINNDCCEVKLLVLLILLPLLYNLFSRNFHRHLEFNLYGWRNGFDIIGDMKTRSDKWEWTF